MVSFNLFKSGKSVPEIAKERKLVTDTIEGHLSFFIGTGEINLDELISPERQLLIKDAVLKFSSEGLKVVLENLPPDFSYNEIRMVLASEKRVG